jgi:xanthine dehydrogenase accessory factor
VRWLDRGEECLLTAADSEDAALSDAISAALRSDKSRSVEINGERLFLQVFNPPLRMLVVGAVHIAQALVPIAQLTGYQVVVTDPRRAFAADDRFADVECRTDWPDDAFTALVPDARTAIVTLTHDPKIDDPALRTALNSSAFYIGALGSRRTHQARLSRLHADGFDSAATDRICGPIGLHIGAVSPAEIAIAIMAQVTSKLRLTDTTGHAGVSAP